VKRALAELGAYTAGYVVVVAIERAIAAVERQQAAFDAALAAGEHAQAVAVPVVGIIQTRSMCLCGCQEAATVGETLSGEANK
jgi:hypothetical protein